MDYASLLTFCVARLQIRPADFWQMTFAEFWPLWNAVNGTTEPLMTVDDLENMEAAWMGAVNGNS